MELFLLGGGLLAPFLIFRSKDFFQPELFVNFLFVVLIGLGPFVLFFFMHEHYKERAYSDVSLIILLGYLGLNLGFVLARVCSASSVLANGLCADYSGWLLRKSRGMYILGLFLSFVSIVAGFIYFYRAGFIPLFSSNKEEARVAAMSVSGNGYFLYLLAIGVVAPSFMALFYLRDGNPFRLLSPLFVLVLVSIAMLLLFTGSRRYVVWMFIYLLAVYHYVFRMIPVRRLLFFSGLGLFFVVLFEIFRNPDSDTTAGFLVASMYRLVIYTSNLEKVYSYFGDVGFMWGGTFFMDILTILPGKQIDYQSWLKELVGLEFEGFGIPPTVMGDFYINFGLLGVCVGTFIVGFLLRVFYQWMILRGRSGLGLLLYVSILEVGSKTITSGVSAQGIGYLWVAVFYSCALFFMAVICSGSRRGV